METNSGREREVVSVLPRIFASLGQSLIIAGFGVQIIGALGGGYIGYHRFAMFIAGMCRQKKSLLKAYTPLSGRTISCSRQSSLYRFVLQQTGYIPNSPDQSMLTMNSIRILMCAAPALSMLTAYVIYKNAYKLSDSFMKKVIETIQERRFNAEA